jgi:hypothetical protein
MKRLVWGIVLMVIGAMGFVGVVTKNDPRNAFTSILMIGGGGTLIYFGKRFLRRKKVATEIALQMLRKTDKIDAADVARRVGMSEVDVRCYLMESQRKGLIPFKADIE